MAFNACSGVLHWFSKVSGLGKGTLPLVLGANWVPVRIKYFAGWMSVFQYSIAVSKVVVSRASARQPASRRRGNRVSMGSLWVACTHTPSGAFAVECSAPWGGGPGIRAPE